MTGLGVGVAVGLTASHIAPFLPNVLLRAAVGITFDDASVPADIGTWTINRVTRAGTGPWTLTEDSQTGIHLAYYDSDLALGHPVAVTIRAKRGTGTRNVQVMVGSNSYVNVRLSDGAVLGQNLAVAEVDYDSGTGEYIITTTTTGAQNGVRISLRLLNGVTVSYTGDSSSSIIVDDVSITQERVGQFADQTSNGNDVAQTIDANQPLVGLNGGAQFDGSDDVLVDADGDWYGDTTRAIVGLAFRADATDDGTLFDDSEQSIKISFDTDTIKFEVTSGNYASLAFTSVDYTTLVALYDGAGADNAARLRIWLDGAEQDLSAAFTGTIPANITRPSGQYLGNNEAGTDGFDGELLEVQAAGASQATSLYAGLLASSLTSRWVPDAPVLWLDDGQTPKILGPLDVVTGVSGSVAVVADTAPADITAGGVSLGTITSAGDDVYTAAWTQAETTLAASGDSVAVSEIAGTATHIPVVLVVGQSNADRLGTANGAGGETHGIFWRCQDASDQTNTTPTTADVFDPAGESSYGAGVAQQLAADLGAADIGLIRWAIDGTDVVGQWVPNYDSAWWQTYAEPFIAAQISAIETASGKTARVVGVLYHQGETTASANNMAAYRFAVETLFDRLRALFTEARFAISEVHGNTANRVRINELVHEIADAASDVRAVRAQGYTYSDGTHLDVADAITHGKRLVRALGLAKVM